MLRFVPFRLVLACLALGAVAFLRPAPAAACGGFFCDNNTPVNQQAERIIFATEADGSVTAVIEIQYEGPSERFAWMLPVAGVPEVAISSTAAFDRIQGASNPTYMLQTEVEGTCRGDSGGRGRVFPGSADSGGLGAEFDDGPTADSGVTVVDAGSVGPFDYVNIALDPDAADLVAVAIEWLQDNGYDVPDLGSDVLSPYLEAGMNLLAFRLTKGNDAGSIRPVRLSFGEGLPAIPLRPTAVAATPDMGILVWVLGESRAVPANYRSLELNEALIDWFRPGTTYDDVVTRAANEAQGQGFVTEMSGPAPELGAVIWSEGEGAQWNAMRAADWTGLENELLAQIASSSFLGLDGMRDVIEALVPPPAGVSPEDFAGCVECFLFDYRAGDIEGFEPDEFLAAVAEDVIAPLVETQALFEAAAVQTRFYTTMSADEMTMDPVFDFNPELGPYSKDHTARRVIECSPAVWQDEAPWRVELDSGDVVRGRDNVWPFAPGADEDMPATSRIRRVGTSGEGDVAVDNTPAIAEALAEHNRTIPGPPRVDGFCAAGGSPAAGVGVLGLALAALAFRRRRV
ncbi:MAG: DUF2330 domain-containing protein [Myxococcota bacterium]